MEEVAKDYPDVELSHLPMDWQYPYLQYQAHCRE
jgi:hypothetical protein